MRELRKDAWWSGGLALASTVGLVFLACITDWTRDSIWGWVEAQRYVIAVTLAAVSAAQLATTLLRNAAADLSELQQVDGSRWPQRLLGLVEILGYGIGFATVPEPDKVLAGAGAWIALKQFGNWPRWSTSEKKEDSAGISTSPKPQASLPVDHDEKRRRFYVFLFANALQIGGGAVVGCALRWALRP